MTVDSPSDGGVVSPEAAESDLLRQDDVHRVLLLLPARASRLPQQVLPLLAHQLAVLCVGQPRFTAAEEHDARGAQDHQAGEQRQQAEAEQLAVGDQHTVGVHRLLQGDLQQVPLGRPQELVEGVSRQGVMLRRQCRKPVVGGLAGSRRPRPDFRPLLMEGTVGSREGLMAGTVEGRAEACAVATVLARVGLTAVGNDGGHRRPLAKVPRKSQRTQTGGGSRRAVGVHARAAVLTRRAGERRRGTELKCATWKLKTHFHELGRVVNHRLYKVLDCCLFSFFSSFDRAPANMQLNDNFAVAWGHRLKCFIKKKEKYES